MIYWILIASAAEAKLFSTTGGSTPLQLQQHLEHPAGRALEQDLNTDEPGRYAKGGKGGILSSMEHRMTPHRVEETRFAKQLAAVLETGLERREYERLAIFAPAQLLGILREAISDGVRKSIVASDAKDLVKMDPRELPKHLSAVLPILNP
jgi:protein required for attachment to host cells